jgi:Rieske 2Fe-2S family protein
VTIVDLDAAPPIGPDLLGPVLRPIERARTLPSEAYTSSHLFAWERRRFFEGSWVCVGRSDGLKKPGDQRAAQVGDEGVLLVHGRDGAVGAFFNVCRHRAHELLARGETASRHAIQCPYHAWVYGLDGRLRATPRFGALPEDDPVHQGLTPARVREWQGWIFINASGDAPSLEQHVGDLDGLLRPYGLERMVVCATHEYEVEANWKLVVENYHECYHCPSIHPELCRVTPTESGINFEPAGLWAGGSMDLEADADTMSLDGRSEGHVIPGLGPDRLRQVFYFGLFPNFLISPHPDYVMTHRIEPLAPGRSRIECQWLFPPEAVDRPGFDPAYAVEFWDLTNRQDWRACESVQRGVSSRGYRPGPLSPSEIAVHHFMRMVAGGYLTGRPVGPMEAPVMDPTGGAT